MKLKTYLAVFVLALVPVVSYAQCSGEHRQTAMSCAEGMVMDEETGTCIPLSTS